jgi:hypothetical protein
MMADQPEKYEDVVKEFEPLDLYERAYVDGLLAHAWWKDGRMQVGTTGTSLATAVRKFLEPRRPRAQARSWNEATGEGVEMTRGMGRAE